MKHTLGPWRYVYDRMNHDEHRVMTAYEQYDGEDSTIAICGCQADEDGYVAATARLIAAAPDMLGALRGVAAQFKSHEGEAAWVSAVFAALAKADPKELTT